MVWAMQVSMTKMTNANLLILYLFDYFAGLVYSGSVL